MFLSPIDLRNTIKYLMLYRIKLFTVSECTYIYKKCFCYVNFKGYFSGKLLYENPSKKKKKKNVHSCLLGDYFKSLD